MAGRPASQVGAPDSSANHRSSFLPDLVSRHRIAFCVNDVPPGHISSIICQRQSCERSSPTFSLKLSILLLAALDASVWSNQHRQHNSATIRLTALDYPSKLLCQLAAAAESWGCPPALTGEAQPIIPCFPNTCWLTHSTDTDRSPRYLWTFLKINSFPGSSLYFLPLFPLLSSLSWFWQILGL